MSERWKLAQNILKIKKKKVGKRNIGAFERWKENEKKFYTQIFMQLHAGKIRENFAKICFLWKLFELRSSFTLKAWFSLKSFLQWKAISKKMILILESQ